MTVIMIGLPVADNVISVGQVSTHVDLVDHQRHVNRIAGVRVNVLSRVVAQDAQWWGKHHLPNGGSLNLLR